MDTSQKSEEEASAANQQQQSRSSFSPCMKIQQYVMALRPWSFSVSLVPVLLGYTLAHKTGITCNALNLLITALCALFVHAAGNAVNTYYDYVKGIDSKKSDDRILVDHVLTEQEIISIGIVLYSLGCLCFIALSMRTPVKLEHLAIIYFCGLSSSFLYTGGIGFKYIALGDVTILVIFGPMTVLFSYVIQTGYVNWGIILYAIPLALNAEAILHSNNTRDLESDKRAGIVTLAILIGPTASEVLYALFLFAPFTMFVVWGLKYSTWLLLPLITIPEAFRIERHFRMVSKHPVPRKTAKLGLSVGFLYVVALFMANSDSLPFIKV